MLHSINCAVVTDQKNHFDGEKSLTAAEIFTVYLEFCNFFPFHLEIFTLTKR